MVGQSLDDRNVALSGLVTSFAVGGVLAIVLMSALGYAVATAGLAPVEAMRRRAAEVSLTHDGERLPLPAAHDEIRRLGETLNDMLDRLRRSFDRERQFVADASHELRTPVAVVKTELEGALRTGDYGPHVREALVAAIDECDHLAQMAEDLLIIARAGEGELPVRRETVGVGPLFDGVREHFIDRATQHGRAMRIDAPAGLEVRADALRLGQALGNLVDNAIRYGAGDITLRARGAPGGVVLEVCDQGPGFGARHRGPGVRAVRARRRRPYARGDGPGDGDRPRGGRGARGLRVDRRRATAPPCGCGCRRTPCPSPHARRARPGPDRPARASHTGLTFGAYRAPPCRSHCSPCSLHSPASPAARRRRRTCRRAASASRSIRRTSRRGSTTATGRCAPGSRWVYREQGENGRTQRVTVTVTYRTRKVAAGSRASVVHDVVTQGGRAGRGDLRLVRAGPRRQHLVPRARTRPSARTAARPREGSWEAGVDGAQAGVIMPARPRVGLRYRQEYYAGHAEDRAQIASLHGRAVVPFGRFSDVLVTRDSNPLSKGPAEHKYYAKGIGPVLGVSGGGSREELVSYRKG